MKALLQRVSSASITVDGRVVGEIGRGLLVFLCAVKGDGAADLDYLCRKISQLRIFPDDQGRMNRSVMDFKGGILTVSQFTLAASTKKGNRPSFDDAEEPGRAKDLYESFNQKLAERGITVRTGIFGADMAVSLTNDGPVTIMLDSRERIPAEAPGEKGPA